MPCEPTVYVVDDDGAVRESLGFLLESVHLKVQSFSSADEFLAAERTRPACVVLDVRMPGASGVELLERMRQSQDHVPVIMLTAYGEIAVAVRSMKFGAIDFIEKPYSDQLLLDRIQHAIEQDTKLYALDQQRVNVLRRYESLTPREREVMAMVVKGMANKSIATELALSEKTVEAHRAHVMEKMDVHALADLVRAAMLARAMPAE